MARIEQRTVPVVMRFRRGAWLMAGLVAWALALVLSGQPVLAAMTTYAPLVLAPAVGWLLGRSGAILAIAAAPLLAAFALPDQLDGAVSVPWLLATGALALV